MKKNAGEPLGERKPVPLRLMSTVHLVNLEPGRLCGCPACLERDGLEMVEVYFEGTGKFRPVLVDWFSKKYERYGRATRRSTPQAGDQGSSGQSSPDSPEEL